MAQSAIGAPVARAPLTGGALVALTAGVALATFMEVLDISIVNVSVRTIAGNLGVSNTEGTMAISAYSMASAIVQPLTGWISRRFGEVKTFAVSVALFVVFSVLCGLANSMTMLIVFRLLQGAVSGPMVPLSQSILLNNYPPDKRPLALALWAMMVVVAPVFGPIMGGWITDNYSWAWIFFINIPIGLFALAVTWILLRKRETRTAKIPLDGIGLFLLAVGVGSLQFMLDKGNDYDWFASKLIIVLGVVALVCLTFLVAWELMHKHPVVNLRLLGRRNFGIGVLCLSVGMFAFFGGTVVLPTWLQQVMGYNATWAGFAVAPIGLLAIIMSPLVGATQRHFDLRVLNSIGFAIFAACSFWMASQDTSVGYAQVAIPRLVMGAGIALFFVPVNQIILSGLPDEEIASASGLSNFLRTLAGSVATAVSTTMYEHRTTFHHAMLVQHTQDGATATQAYLNGFGQAGLQGPAAYASLNKIVNAQAATLASNDVFWCFGLMFGLAMVTIWFTRPPFTGGSGGGGH
ncbi:DHA2 family efflux MFS transporter permease subunit [Frateuria aurantia]|uniref:Drug resistance transporter, EmrB/QacA subfamily n=1 Tax=Frateuria aurantia (strain ATCC 33424 / DSM 6220 / KCTC 2777 / LMG 1558 / NBRC 3245 / NCIMB 13370) TaxID=767434 RepID=H8L1A2_FRAAD|nr:DHA2 family efflux MFS transporter permease subunit [Frateuria aurantia]AFC87510.1 drug resistance transporter, EmrB/QacA subfamily [Frateuria aurantia DSM 6220]